MVTVPLLPLSPRLVPGLLALFPVDLLLSLSHQAIFTAMAAVNLVSLVLTPPALSRPALPVACLLENLVDLAAAPSRPASPLVSQLESLSLAAASVDLGRVASRALPTSLPRARHHLLVPYKVRVTSSLSASTLVRSAQFRFESLDHLRVYGNMAASCGMSYHCATVTAGSVMQRGIYAIAYSL